ncbi:endonuclease/exonuclease/phosphatase family protein [Streptomyces sp. JNUCC 64]
MATPLRTDGPPAPPEPPSPEGGERRRTGRGAWLAGALLLGVSVVAGCRVADVDGVTPVPQLLAFLPWLIAPTVVALLLSWFARWRTGLVWGVAAMGVLAWYVDPYGKVSSPDGPPLAGLRVMTSNVEYSTATDGLVKAVVRERPDLLFVQECDPGCLDRLKDRIGTDYPHRTAVEAYGAEGSAILSRTPLRPTDGVHGSTLGMPGAVTEIKGVPVHLQLAHPMPPLPSELGTWRRELDALRAVAAEGTRSAGLTGTTVGAPARSGPMIMAGDFNATQDHAAFRELLDAGLTDGARLADAARESTWPSSTAALIGAQIDHVLVSREFTARDARFLDLGASDHRTVVMDLTLHKSPR